MAPRLVITTIGLYLTLGLSSVKSHSALSRLRPASESVLTGDRRGIQVCSIHHSPHQVLLVFKLGIIKLNPKAPWHTFRFTKKEGGALRHELEVLTEQLGRYFFSWFFFLYCSSGLIQNRCSHCSHSWEENGNHNLLLRHRRLRKFPRLWPRPLTHFGLAFQGKTTF